MRKLKEKVFSKLKEIFWEESCPQNIVMSPIVINYKNKYFLNPIAGEFKDIDGSIYPLKPNHEVNPIIKTCDNKSYFYAVPVDLGNNVFEFLKGKFTMRISFACSFVIVEYEVDIDENSNIWVVWVFQVLKENLQF